MPRTLRASEIAVYVYCQRAWWYQKSGVPSENIAELAHGSALHAQHSRETARITCLQVTGYGLLLAALVSVVVYFMHGIL